LALVVWAWGRRFPIPVAGSILILAAPLATPFCYDYDLVMLALPMAWLAATEAARRLAGADLLVLMALWLLPVAGWLIALHGGVPIAPAVLALGLWHVLRRSHDPAWRQDPAAPLARQAVPSGRNML
jgi:hypothetical protein